MKKEKAIKCALCCPERKKYLGQQDRTFEYIDADGNLVVSLGAHRYEVHKKDGTVLVYGPNKYSPSFRGDSRLGRTK